MEVNDKKISVDELEQMRHEMNELRSLLSEQQIVNGRLMRRAMSADMGEEKRDMIVSIVVAVIAIPVYLYFLPQFGLPVWFAIVTAAYFLICCGASVWSLWRLSSENVITGNLVTVAERIVAYKRFRNRWLCCAIPAVCLWISAFVYYVSAAMPDSDEREGFFYGCFFGVVLGGTLGALHLRKSRRRLNRMLRQIVEVKSVE